MNESSIQQRLTERVKELTALHTTARLLQDTTRPIAGLMHEIVEALPSAWQYPEICGARLRLLDEVYATPAFAAEGWVQRATFVAKVEGAGSDEGLLEISYREERPAADEGPFLREERALIDSLAEMLRMYAQHQLADRVALRAHGELEREIEARTAELRTANRALEAEIEEHRRARAKLERQREQLRRLANELALAEASERRAIAADLHDHLGQALAFVRLRLAHLAGDAVFSGLEANLEDILTLVDRAIRYTRSLTAELSPPVLYELGLAPALEWLAEELSAKHPVKISVRAARDLPSLSEPARVMIWKSARELLTNTIKHASATEARMELSSERGMLRLTVIDDGVGFEPAQAEARAASAEMGTFGLFSVRERVNHLGGALEVRSSPGSGTTIIIQVPLAAIGAP